MLDVIFIGNFPQPPLNHSREKEWTPLKIIIAHPLGKLWILPYCVHFHYKYHSYYTISVPALTIFTCIFIIFKIFKVQLGDLL